WRMGRLRDAAEALNQAASVAAEDKEAPDPELLLDLAEVEWALGATARARRALEQAAAALWPEEVELLARHDLLEARLAAPEPWSRRLRPSGRRRSSCSPVMTCSTRVLRRRSPDRPGGVARGASVPPCCPSSAAGQVGKRDVSAGGSWERPRSCWGSRPAPPDGAWPR